LLPARGGNAPSGKHTFVRRSISADVPALPGNLVVTFVRARKPGDDILAGVSTRRLVSVRVA